MRGGGHEWRRPVCQSFLNRRYPVPHYPSGPVQIAPAIFRETYARETISEGIRERKILEGDHHFAGGVDVAPFLSDLDGGEPF